MAARDGGGVLSPKTIIPAAAVAAAVSTSTILMAWRKLGQLYQLLNFALRVPGGNDVTFVFERADDGATNEHQPLEVLVAAGKGKPSPFKNELDLWYQLSAHTDSPGFPASSALFQLDGLIWHR